MLNKRGQAETKFVQPVRFSIVKNVNTVKVKKPTIVGFLTF